MMPEPLAIWRWLSAGLILLVITFASSTARAANPEALKRHAEALAPVVQLDRNCSGTVVASAADIDGKVRTLILTAKHCVPGRDEPITVNVPTYVQGRIVSEIAYRATVDEVSYKHDLAVLVLPEGTPVLPHVAKLGAADVALIEGETVWAVGFPKGEVRTLTEGAFGNRQSVKHSGVNGGKLTEFFRATTNIAGGNSGGALFHQAEDGSYKLIGVASLAWKDATFMAYFVPIDAIRNFLKTKPGSASSTMASSGE